jgi:hypothetical protein
MNIIGIELHDPGVQTALVTGALLISQKLSGQRCKPIYLYFR